MIFGKQRLSFLIKYCYISHGFGQVEHVFAEACNFGCECRFLIGGVCTLDVILTSTPALQLPAPDAPKIDVRIAIGISKHSWVDTETAFQWLWFCFKGACRCGACSYTDPKYVFLIFCREVEIVFAVGECCIGSP